MNRLTKVLLPVIAVVFSGLIQASEMQDIDTMHHLQANIDNMRKSIISAQVELDRKQSELADFKKNSKVDFFKIKFENHGILDKEDFRLIPLIENPEKLISHEDYNSETYVPDEKNESEGNDLSDFIKFIISALLAYFITSLLFDGKTKKIEK